MSARTNTRITLASRPDGMPTDENFTVESVPAPEPAEGEVLLKTLWLSLDPYMRGRMSDRKSYAAPLELGEVITGGVVAQVVESKHPDWAVGDLATNMSGWQQYAVATPGQYRLFRVDPDNAPISTAVGVTGMPGQTAYFGLLSVGKPQPGETVVVSAASGAVGATVGQIAKIHGCRVVGVAGGAEKCAFCVDELGFDACVDYKSDSFAADLAAACPDGVDVYFENVGGAVLEAVAPLLNPGSRVPVCGYISAYNTPNGETIEPPDAWLKRTLADPPETRFFVVTEWIEEFDAATAQLGAWIREGRLKYRESVVEGIENAPSAFRMLFTGENFGKLLIHVADPE
ncbi:MAG: NADP-dependent oxidoreductase [Pseudomonadales bacterium]|jgi:NADPH-dependent curcumin reductase CurA|nr:NADP-dependent oxidoreductase [Pseudomonadales bacterium]